MGYLYLLPLNYRSVCAATEVPYDVISGVTAGLQKVYPHFSVMPHGLVHESEKNLCAHFFAHGDPLSHWTIMKFCTVLLKWLFSPHWLIKRGLKDERRQCESESAEWKMKCGATGRTWRRRARMAGGWWRRRCVRPSPTAWDTRPRSQPWTSRAPTSAHRRTAATGWSAPDSAA